MPRAHAIGCIYARSDGCLRFFHDHVYRHRTVLFGGAEAVRQERRGAVLEAALTAAHVFGVAAIKQPGTVQPLTDTWTTGAYPAASCIAREDLRGGFQRAARPCAGHAADQVETLHMVSDAQQPIARSRVEVSPGSTDTAQVPLRPMGAPHSIVSGRAPQVQSTTWPLGSYAPSAHSEMWSTAPPAGSRPPLMQVGPGAQTAGAHSNGWASPRASPPERSHDPIFRFRGSLPLRRSAAGR